MASSSSMTSLSKTNPPSMLDFDQIMPSSERRMDFVPVHVPSVTSDTIDETPTPDPRWPHLNRWSSQPTTITPAVTVIDTRIIGEASSPALLVSPHAEEPSKILTDAQSSVVISQGNNLVSDSVVPAATTSKNHNHSLPISKGAWEKPLVISSTRHIPKLSQEGASIGESEQDRIALKAYSKDFPWAGKMNPSLRNLHRVTIPEHLEDGTPLVRIPSHVLLGGIENQKEFVVGQFYHCSAPSRGLIQAVVTRIWGRKCNIFIRKLGESNYLFHIPDESTRKWVLERGVWHVDGCLMFVSAWSTSDTISLPEVTTLPVWLTLKNIPDQLYSILGIKWIASGIGEPMSSEKPWLDPTQMGEAKILVEVKLNKPFPQKVALLDKSDAVTMVDVVYSWLPSKCSICGKLGHKPSRCLLRSANGAGSSVPLDKENSNTHVLINSAPVITTPSVQETTPGVAPTATCNMPSASKHVSSPLDSRDASNIHSTTVVLLKDTSTSKQISPTTSAELSIRRSSSTKDLGSNRFASLDSSEEDGGNDSEEEFDPVDLLTPSGKRILRERPVKPSAKAMEVKLHFVSATRGNRGRGKGGRG